jgi:hypothetical protein
MIGPFTYTAAVVGFALTASGVCLLLGVVFTFMESGAERKLRAAAKAAGDHLAKSQPGENPVQAQTAPIDFGGLAKLAEALGHLNRSGRFLIVSLGFAAIAAATTITSVAVNR